MGAREHSKNMGRRNRASYSYGTNRLKRKRYGPVAMNLGVFPDKDFDQVSE
jgi:hypothetical protein